jgi:sugar O-acyltransferase (sialic acid O-acetyltransferase NeuD family)
MRGSSIIVFGCGGHARVVSEAIGLQGGKIICYVDEIQDPTVFQHRESIPVRNSWQQALKEFGRGIPFLVAIGNNTARLNRSRQLLAEGIDLVTVQHPSAIVSQSALIGAGTFIGPGAVVNTGARIGLACIVNSQSSVGHDCIVGDGVHIAPSATLCGWCHVGDEVWVGAGSSVRDRVRIGNRCVIGLGSSLVSDIAEGMVVVGCPAKPIKRPSAL